MQLLNNYESNRYLQEQQLFYTVSLVYFRASRLFIGEFVWGAQSVKQCWELRHVDV